MDVGTTHCYVQGEEVTLKVWDTAGEERYSSIPTSFYKNADGLILMYDCTRKETMANIDKWWTKINENCDTSSMTIIIVCNKIDLENARQVTPDEAEEYAYSKGRKFFESSAKNGENVTDIYKYLADHIYSKRENSNSFREPTLLVRRRATTVHDVNLGGKKGGKCCS